MVANKANFIYSSLISIFLICSYIMLDDQVINNICDFLFYVIDYVETETPHQSISA